MALHHQNPLPCLSLPSAEIRQVDDVFSEELTLIGHGPSRKKVGLYEKNARLQRLNLTKTPCLQRRYRRLGNRLRLQTITHHLDQLGFPQQPLLEMLF